MYNDHKPLRAIGIKTHQNKCDVLCTIAEFFYKVSFAILTVINKISFLKIGLHTTQNTSYNTCNTVTVVNTGHRTKSQNPQRRPTTEKHEIT